MVGLLMLLKTGQLYSVECKYNLCEIKLNKNMKCFRTSGLGLADFLRGFCHSESSASIYFTWPLINTLFNLRFLQLVLGLPMKESGEHSCTLSPSLNALFFLLRMSLTSLVIQGLLLGNGNHNIHTEVQVVGSPVADPLDDICYLF